MSNKKNEQLGMSHSTAAHRLRKSIMWKYIQMMQHDTCHQCGKKINSEDELSIEHKEPWLDSDNPVEKFFDLNNIAYSHLNCNAGAARRKKADCGTYSKYKNSGCRCDDCKKARHEYDRKSYDPSNRRQKYLRTGK